MSTITISLPNQIAEKVDEETKNQGFATRSEFMRNLLRRYFLGQQVEFDSFTKRPLDEVRHELAKTGKYSEKFIDSVAKGLAKSSQYAR